jgi:hypothetical protein
MMESISPKRPAAAQGRSRSMGGRGAALFCVSACVTHCSLSDFDSLSADLDADQLHNGDFPAGAAGGSSGGDAGTGPNVGGGGAGGDGGSSGEGNGGSAGDDTPDGGSADEPEAGAPQNLFLDPTFEEGSPRWTPVGACNLALSTDNPRSGSHCLLTTNRLAATWEGPGYDLLGLLEQSTTYTATAWVRAPEGSFVVNWTFKNRCVDVEGEALYTPLLSARATTTWTELTASFTTPPCPLIDSLLYVEGPAIGVEFYIDDVSLFRTGP